MKLVAIVVSLSVVVAIATSCAGPDDSAAERAAPVKQDKMSLGLTPQQVADVAGYLRSFEAGSEHGKQQSK